MIPGLFFAVVDRLFVGDAAGGRGEGPGGAAGVVELLEGFFAELPFFCKHRKYLLNRNWGYGVHCSIHFCFCQQGVKCSNALETLVEETYGMDMRYTSGLNWREWVGHVMVL